MQTTKRLTSRSSASGERGLTSSAFEALLQALSPDRDEAAERYEVVRRKLIRLFAWRGSRDPEELADGTLNRVAKKLEGGLEIEAADPYRFICAVAYRIFQEKLRAAKRTHNSLQEYGLEHRRTTGSSPEGGAEVTSPLQVCFKRCLHRAPTEERDIVLRYYEGEKGERIQKRRALASRLGLQLNNLRVRAYRIRHRLEQCTRRCVQRSEDGEEDHA